MNEHISETQIQQATEKIQALQAEIEKKIVGQTDLIESIIVAFLAHGHVLLEGLPGLAKTLTIHTLSEAVDLGFSRIQFTPDLLPSDLIGAEIYNTQKGIFEIKKWPIFNNFILADEINRAPSKVQSALLEAMAEKHISIGNDTFALEQPFFVLATQNPIEQSGTYALPEAQLDRFMFKIHVDYPSKEEEQAMYKKILSWAPASVQPVLSQQELCELETMVQNIYVSDSIFSYVANIVDATRFPEKYAFSLGEQYIDFGASPRGGLSLIAGAKAYALMQGRSYVIPEDIQKLAVPALAHRIVLNYEAGVDEVSQADIITKVIETLQVV